LLPLRYNLKDKICEGEDGSLRGSTKRNPAPPNQRRIVASCVRSALAVVAYLGLIVNPGLTTIGQRHLAGPS
jgi:hypothetical protein